MRIMVLIFLFSQFAFGFPSVGDHIQWKTSGTKGLQSFMGTGDLKVLDYDAKKDIYLLEFTDIMTYSDKDPIKSSNAFWSKAVDLVAPPFGDVFQNCETKFSGRITSITVPAGTFPVCEMQISPASWMPKGTITIIWAMDFPYPQVKQIFSAGDGSVVSHLYISKLQVAPTPNKPHRWFPAMQTQINRLLQQAQPSE